MLKAVLTLGLCLALVGCGGGTPDRSAARSDVTGGEITVTSSNFTDADPTDWTGRAPERYPVHGIDLSRFQTGVDWPTARANGVNFAFIKATEGGDLVDPMFDSHWRGAGVAGVKRGAYHFFYHCRPAAEQARWYIRHVPRTPGALPPVLDMEWTPTSPTCTIRRDGATIREEARIFIDIVARHYGQRPLIYTTVDFYEDTELWRLSGVEFWLRSVAAHPNDRYDGQSWSFWQYTSTGLVPGIAGRVDVNVFAGSKAAWAEWVGARAL
ncbi:MAG: GH25 family lysozyme [Tabrizicola sp.]|uniref:glycoside hydrolase family 25 protein n=1 Tax=Tabrizicola sp. TaxID=2005166 RepID=UPI0027337575|nr:GH25 family lysozyme [Tabrizicola sp.]MDP3262594.1 GH25 family lysozyme [Tabrizicola sp.]MDP3647754.1 GH25 family lysozyme [Paracoccaceae bacterium]MDZ4066216.1 GH25 family lysozyme [Tabrizicola sp.]